MTSAQQARTAAGLSLDQAAQAARIGADYLRRIERSGGCSYALAVRLARLYRCSANVFLTKIEQGSETPETKRQSNLPAGGHE